jgi:peptidoglycan/xylan/chitin deacetylase (PgdA/CDA1 family)
MQSSAMSSTMRALTPSSFSTTAVATAPQTVAALPRIIDTLRARGYEFGRLSTTSGAAGPKVAISEE